MADQQGWLKLQVGGEQGGVSADAFLDFFTSAVSALRAIDQGISRYGAETIEWRVVGAGSGSPIFAVLQGTSLSSNDGAAAEEVIGSFVSGIDALGTGRSRPARFTERALQHVKRMAAVAARYDLRPVVVTAAREVHVSSNVAGNADWALRELDLIQSSYTEYGSLEGTLKTISSVNANRDKLLIVDRLSGAETPCYLRGEALRNEATVRQAWKRRVVVSGDITVDRRSGRPQRVMVDDIKILREREELPQMDDLHGIDITGGVESAEFVRGLRDDD